MKISYNPDILCLFTPISQLKYLRWRVGGNHKTPFLENHPCTGGGGGATYPSWFTLPPTQDFWAVIGNGFWIAVNCFNNYKWICFTKYRYCLLVYKNPFLEIHPFTGGGQHIPTGLPYPPPKILKQWLFTDNIMTFKYYITQNKENFSWSRHFFCLFTLILCLKYLRCRVGGNHKTPFLENHPFTGGAQHIPAGLPYPPPKILERWLFTDNEMALKYYIT